MTMADELAKLQTLRENGALTEDEFVLAKQKVLNAKQAEAKTPAPKATSALQAFTRSLNDRWIGGVCGGLAETTAIPTWTWRILFVLTAFLHGLGILMYVLLWIFVPLQRPALPVIAAPTKGE
jgi:phage shock protein C